METKNLSKQEEAFNTLEENVRFYISTPEKFAEALIFAKKLEKFSEQIKEKVKDRGAEIMVKNDLKEIEFGDYKVIKQDPTKSIEYYAPSVFMAFGEERALTFMKVDNTKLKNYILKARIEGEELNKLNLNRKEKERKGFIKLIEKKQ